MRTATILFILVLVQVTSGALAQESAELTQPEAETPSEKPEAPEKVDVQPVARDDEIANRLQDILTATKWFEGPEVEVRDGVVFLRGEASQEDFRRWATDLAQSTQDVAAVVNRMSVAKRGLFDMTPAIAELRSFAGSAIQMTPLLLFGVIVLGLTWLIARGARTLAELTFHSRISNPLLRNVFAKTVMVPILLLGIYIVLRVTGLTQLAFTVLGGTGIAGLILGIAFRDIAENFLASILISMQNPFRTGDLVEVGGNRGFVQRVSTRGTLLMTLDGNHVMVPNAIIYKSVVTNYSANPNRRVDFGIGIGYDDSISKAQRLIKEILDDHPMVLSDPESRVILDELGASTVNLRVYVWLDGAKHNPDSVRSSILRIVKQTLLREGISLPDEAREVIFPNQVPVRMITEEHTDSNAGSGSPEDDTTQRADEHEDESVISIGEGIANEAEEIKRQAAQSWNPEEGENLLENEGAEVATTGS